jgi:hypothetical protein
MSSSTRFTPGPCDVIDGEANSQATIAAFGSLKSTLRSATPEVCTSPLSTTGLETRRLAIDRSSRSRARG